MLQHFILRAKAHMRGRSMRESFQSADYSVINVG